MGRRGLQHPVVVGAILTVIAGCSFQGSWQTGSGEPSSGGEAERAERRKRADRELDRIDRETRERVTRAEREAADEERKADEEAVNAGRRAVEEHRRRREAQQAAAQPGHTASETPQTTTNAPPAPAASTPSAGDTRASTKVRRDDPGRMILHKPSASSDVSTDLSEADGQLTHQNDTISRDADGKKRVIRKKLEQNKADILVAAERKRNEVRAALKEDAKQKP